MKPLVDAATGACLSVSAEQVVRDWDVMSEGWLRECAARRFLVDPPRPEHFKHLSNRTRKRLYEDGYWDQFAVPYWVDLPTTEVRLQTREGCHSSSPAFPPSGGIRRSGFAPPARLFFVSAGPRRLP